MKPIIANHYEATYYDWIKSVLKTVAKHKRKMTSWFLKRGYHENVINALMEKVRFRQRSVGWWIRITKVYH